uniref:diguanylate cyclase n=1 Tax=Magnetococcus massalia (strain MO-1) TaxID=451514 RepID=A0A1S7LF03_MAGMO|nr:putative Response regulator receiver modulated diguanylate cyclase [Candidatus Magnetococcus massalia]
MSEEREAGRILIVDDMVTNIKILKQAIDPKHQVFFATNGTDALQLSLEKGPDLILLDVAMPDLDGFEVCKRLKADPVTADIPVIFVTSMEAEEDELKGLRSGAVDFITKPVRSAVVAQRVDIHIKLRLLQRKLEALSYHDGLTGVANRRRFNELFKTEWARSIRSPAPISLIMVDVDHFKQFNDHYGHQAGDDCLRTVAHAMEQSLKRVTDLLARYGGEEFVVLMPGTDEEGAKQVGEALLKVVAELQIPHAYSSIAEQVVTISVGMVSCMPDKLMHRDSLNKAADDALYQAKQQGRNRMCIGSCPLDKA